MRPSPAPRRPVHRVAFYGFLGSGNIGNDASLETVLAWLRSEYPDVDVRCITITPELVEARYGVPSVPLAWYRPRPGAPGAVTAIGKAVGRLVDVPRSLRLAGGADAVVVPGMGVLEEALGVTPWGLPLWLFLTAAACRLRRRPFVLLAVGAEPVRHRLTRALFVATVALATHVSYRDEASREAMRANGAREPDAVVPDVVFAHPVPARAEPRPGAVVVGVMAYHGDDDDPARGAPVLARYVRAVAEVVGPLARAGDDVVLVGGDRMDTAVARQVADAVRAAHPDLRPGAVAVRDVDGFAALTAELARAEVVVASRFHNLVCALRLARPVVSVGYAPKSARLMAEFGLTGYCQEIGSLDAALLLDQIGRARAEGRALSARIASVTSARDAQVTALFRELATAACLGVVE